MSYNTLTVNNIQVYGLDNAIRASGNPMRTNILQPDEELPCKGLKRAYTLSNTNIGEGHDQFLTGIIVQFDLYAPLYMWKQLQRYHFLDFISSMSTMHKLTQFNISECCVPETDPIILSRYQDLLNQYNDTQDQEEKSKLWRTLVASLPSGFVLGATLTTNYRQLKTIYHQRKNHKLSEWRTFLQILESNLPYPGLFTTTTTSKSN